MLTVLLSDRGSCRLRSLMRC